MAQTHLPQHWRLRLLDLFEKPRSEANLDFLQAWSQAEGGTATRNPLNTTYPLPWGSSDYNTSHVKNYSTPLQGIAATALTLDQATFAPILAALSADETAETKVDLCEEALRVWGTNPQLMREILETM